MPGASTHRSDAGSTDPCMGECVEVFRMQLSMRVCVYIYYSLDTTKTCICLASQRRITERAFHSLYRIVLEFRPYSSSHVAIV